MLDDRGVEYVYRDYRKEPLAATEIRSILKKLGMRAADVLRRNDPAFKQLALRGDETDRVLVPLMAEHPTLLQRPIGVTRGAAAVGRPPEALLELVD